MLTVVIPTRNRADLLGRALESIETQTLARARFEVLVVDNGSTDETAAVAAAFGNRLGNLRCVYAPEPGLHVGRHAGLREAKGDVLVYADDDIRALPTWLEAIEENFRDPAVAMVGGNNLPDFFAPPPRWLERLWKRPFAGGHAIVGLSVIELAGKRRPFSPYLVWGCNFSIRRQVLLDCGGFHPDGMPQELIRFRGDGETHVSAHVLASGMRCMFDPRASVRHAVTPERMTFDYFRRRAYNQGVSDSYRRLRGEPEAPAPRSRAGRLAPLLNLARRARALLQERLAGRDLRELARLERAWVHRPDYF
jgi:glycosyltransferase involved in cell wall biosynthesis